MRKLFLALTMAFLSVSAYAKEPQPNVALAAPKTQVLAAPIIDINHASATELASLKGIGPARADAIIKGRPYSGKDSLIAKKIIPASVYDGIKTQIIAKQK